MKILAISGSLRAVSVNTALLRAAAQLAPTGIKITLLAGTGELPLFNPDLEAKLPKQVIALHRQVNTADALLIASPEYAHGISGTMKNVLDWLVGLESFANKPVAVINTSARAHHADDAIREILKTMSAVIIDKASVTIPMPGVPIDEVAMLQSAAIARAIIKSLAALHASIANNRRMKDPSFPIS